LVDELGVVAALGLAPVAAAGTVVVALAGRRRLAAA
jgi:hypothetical protein